MIGLVGGLGLGAGIHYYRELAAAHEAAARPLDLVIVHADLATVSGYFSAADRPGLAGYLAGLLARLKAAGATLGVVPAVTPHMCIDELAAISPLPLVSMLDAVSAALAERGFGRVALFGTRFAIESDMFGKLRGVEVVRPRPDEIALIHDVYMRLARTGAGTAEDHAGLCGVAATLQARDRVDAVVLAGTDLTVLFDEAHTPFPHLDCAHAHIQAIMRAIPRR
jgi:aspartate racemase